MSNKTVFKLNYEGVSELMKSEGMKSVLKQYANSVMNNVGDGYSISEYTGSRRANASIHAVSRKAKKENLRNNTLLKALGSARNNQ